MPLPEPMPNETEQEFVDRFMGDSQAVSDFPDEQQRSAVAYSMFGEGKDLGFFFETKKYESIDFKPTEAMAKAAQRGLDMRKKQPPSNRGGTAVGLARARQLINRETLSPSTVKRMYSFFSRHEVDKQSESWKKGNSKAEQAWCLQADTKILMADGSFKTIKEICENKISEDVMSYNTETKCFEQKPIINWFINESDYTEFIKLGRNKENKRGLYSGSLISATKEHPFYSKGEWIDAKDMRGKPYSFIDYSFDDVASQVVFGTALGDSHIPEQGSMRCIHCEKQADYAKEKARLLSVFKTTLSFDKNNNANLYVSPNSMFLDIRKELSIYNNKRKVSLDFLNKLNDIAIAFWIMDDGSLSVDKRGNANAYSYRLHTEGFDFESVENIVEFFRSKNMDCNIVKRENCDRHCVYFTRAGSRVLSKAIAPYIVESMKYKLPEHLRNVEYKLADYTPSKSLYLATGKITNFRPLENETDKYHTKKRSHKLKYNITVADNNNYFANGILTHNCLWGGDPGFSWSKRKVEQMKKEDSKKGDIDLNIQHKDFFFEVKAVGEKGAFEGLASPYGNVDHGGDMVMPTIGAENNGNKVPLLWQHERKSIIGEGTLFNSPQGVKIKGNFFLDKIDGAFAVPKAAEAYMLAKKGVLKFSIGYMINPGGASHTPKGVRELKSIVIKEVSCVTFPMNDEAKIESVKTAENQHLDKCYNEENKSEGGAERLEVKARTCKQIMESKNYRMMLSKGMDALYQSMNEIFRDEMMNPDQKKAMVNQSLAEFVPMMNESACGYIDSMANMKSDEIPLETKEFKPVEEQKSEPKINETMKKALEMAREIAKKGDDE